MIPDNLVTLSFHFIRKNKPNVKITIKSPWIMISEKSIMMLRNRMEIPNTNTTFIIFEPMILPITMLVSPCLAAEKDVANSGNEVPSATLDMPMTREETPKASAIPCAPFTKSVAPIAKPIMPIITGITK